MDELIELRHLRYFRAVAEELHFGRAALRLHIAQPPLSQQIRRLEEIIGYPLFVRTSRSVKLTPAGTALLERSRRTLVRVREDLEIVRSVARGEVGSLSVGFVGSAMLTRLPSILGRYREQYPEVQLRLRESYTSTLMDEIRDGAIDLGFLRDPGGVKDLHVESILKESFIAVVSRSHVLARHRRIAIERLRDEPFVSFPRTAGDFAWHNTMRLCEEKGFQPNVVQEAPQWLTILRLVGAGLGVTLAPACVQKIATPEVVCRPIASSTHTTGVDLVYRLSEMSPLVASLSRLAKTMFAEV